MASHISPAAAPHTFHTAPATDRDYQNPHSYADGNDVQGSTLNLGHTSTERTRWRLLDERGRQRWRYLRTDDEAKAWPMNTYERYALGLDTVRTAAAAAAYGLARARRWRGADNQTPPTLSNSPPCRAPTHPSKPSTMASPSSPPYSSSPATGPASMAGPCSSCPAPSSPGTSQRRPSPQSTASR